MNINMNRSPSPGLLSPSGTGRSLFSPDSHDSNSNHSEQTAAGTSTPNTEHNHEKRHFTEYKSKFTPFDQYVYNEQTDSFVKHTLDPNLGQQHQQHVSSSKSNQDLTSFQQPYSAINTQGVEVFSGGNTHDAYGNSEPWYKEVVRRNEKAHEYRFKSEVGHNSPLSNYSNNHATSQLGAESPYSSELRQVVSPSGTESIGGDLLTTSDPQNYSTVQVDSKQFKFTPSDYKRDHLISHMANNNNFALPKEQSEQGSNSNRVGARHVQVSSSARPTTRTGAQLRSRSQSTKRQPISATHPAPSANKGQALTKSNQTTPTRAVAPRSTVRSQVPSTTPSKATKPPAKNTPVSSNLVDRPRPTTARTTPSSLKTTPKEPQVKRAPVLTPSTKTTPRPTNGTSSLANKSTPNSTGAKKTTTSTLRTASAPKTATTRPTASPNTSKIASGRLPKTNVTAPSNRAPITGSKSKTMETSKSSTSTTTQSNTVKSIKTPKAIAAIKAKEADIAAASVAATAVAVAAVTVAEVTSSEVVSNALGNKSDHEKTSSTAEQDAIEVKNQLQFEEPVASTLVSERSLFTDETNQLFIGKETGNMLSDELAQAEQEANNYISVEPQMQQVESATREVDLAPVKSDSKDAEKLIDRLDSNELVNGLAGGLVSAEDRFDSSEKELSAELQGEHNRRLNVDNDSYNHQEGDEPYSIMPTASQRVETDNELCKLGDSNSEIFKELDIIQSEKMSKEESHEKETQDDNKELLDTFVSEQPKTYDVHEKNKERRTSSVSLASKDSVDTEKGLETTLEHNEPKVDEFVVRSESLAEEIASTKVGNRYDAFKSDLQEQDSSASSEDQDTNRQSDKAELNPPTNDVFVTDVTTQEQQNSVWNDNFNEATVNTHDIDRHFVDNYDYEKFDVDTSAALVEDNEQRVPTSPQKQQSSDSSSSAKQNDDEHISDLMDSGELDLIGESSPALASANTTLQGAELLNEPARTVEEFTELSNSNNNNRDIIDAYDNSVSNSNLMQEATETVETLLHDDDDHIISDDSQQEKKTQIKQHEQVENRQITSQSAVESDSSSEEENVNKNELLMNVADLETEMKMEMARKSEVARKNSSPQPVLLSADQLTEQFAAKLSNEAIDENSASDKEANESNPHISKEHEEDIIESKLDAKSFSIEDIPINLSELSNSNMAESKKSVEADDRLEKSLENDDLKLSLTNSEDEMIVQPPYRLDSRYNEGLGLEMMAQKEDQLDALVELGDGFSAAIDLPTVAENKMEMLAVKAIVPEISHSRAEESDDDDEINALGGSGGKNLIDTEAVLNSSTATVTKDELLRFNEVKEKILESIQDDVDATR